MREFLIKYIDTSSDDFSYISAYYLWIADFTLLFTKAYNDYSVSKSVQKYIQNDIKDNSITNNSTSSMSEKEYDSPRSKALEKL